jgi:hypothetical protein
MKRGQTIFFEADWWKQNKAKTIKDRGDLEGALHDYENATKGFDADPSKFDPDHCQRILAALDKVEAAAKKTRDECKPLGKLVGKATLDHLDAYPNEIKTEREWFESVAKVAHALQKKDAKIEQMENALAGKREELLGEIWDEASDLAGDVGHLVLLRTEYEKKSEIYWKEQEKIEKMQQLVKQAEQGISPAEIGDENNPKAKRLADALAMVRAATDRLFDGLGEELADIQRKIDQLDPQAAAKRRALNDQVLKGHKTLSDSLSSSSSSSSSTSQSGTSSSGSSSLICIIQDNYAQLLNLIKED